MRERGLRDDAEVFGLRIRSSMKWAFSEMGKSMKGQSCREEEKFSLGQVKY